VIGAAVNVARAAIPLAGKFAQVFAKNPAKAAAGVGRFARRELGPSGANMPQVADAIRKGAAGAAKVMRTPAGKMAGYEAGIAGIGTLLNTGNPLAAAAATAGTYGGNIGLGIGLNAVKTNTSIPEGLRNAAGSEMAQYIGQTVLAGGVTAALSNKPSQTISASQHAEMLQSEAALANAQAAMLQAELQGGAAQSNANAALLQAGLGANPLAGMSGVGMPATTDYSYLQPR